MTLSINARSFSFQILDGVAERFSRFLRKKKEKCDNSICSLWVEAPPSSRAAVFDFSTKFWEDGFLTDLTLLVGPDKIPIKVHKFVLATNFEYFRSMFSTGWKESTSSQVHLPFVSPEDLKLLLKYAYSGEMIVTKENVFKMAVMANYFRSEDLLNVCCNFIRKFIDTHNCVKLFKIVSDLGVNKMRQDCLLFTVYHLSKVDKADLSALPVELLLEIFQHPAAVLVHGNPAESEKQLLHLLWDKVKLLPQKERDELFVKVLKAVHLPQVDNKFFFPLLKEVAHIPEAVQLIAKAGADVDLSETREWYLSRFRNAYGVKLFKCGKPTLVDDFNKPNWVGGWKCYKPIIVNGITSHKYSHCVLINGFPFFVYVKSPNKDEKEYHVESPWTIEHLGLPYKVILEILDDKAEWIPVNTYYNGVVDKLPVDKSGKDKVGWFDMRVKLQ